MFDICWIIYFRDMYILWILLFLFQKYVFKKIQIQNKKERNLLSLQNRKGKTFPVWSDCSVCINIVFNTAPLDLSDQEQEIRALAPVGIRLSFTTETAEEAEKIAETYARRFLFGEAASMKLPEFTRGHFKRGVE